VKGRLISGLSYLSGNFFMSLFYIKFGGEFQVSTTLLIFIA